MMRSALRAGTVAILVFPAWNAAAWKPTTHQEAAVAAAVSLDPSNPLRPELLANERYVRAGAIGPDLWYGAPVFMRYSDMAHYCRTDELAKALRDTATTAQERAFAYGWLSHNVADSVAHPWVNGFTGGPFRDFLPPWPSSLQVNLTHTAIESWVDGQLFAQLAPWPADKGHRAQLQFDAVGPYFEAEIQDLLIAAYARTYRWGTCPEYAEAPLDRLRIEAGARGSWAFMAHSKLSQAKADVDPVGAGQLLDLYLWFLVQETWRDYLDRTVKYLGRAFVSPGSLEAFNLDQGIEPVNTDEVGDVWGKIPGPDGEQVSVFKVPGKQYMPDGGKPPFEHRCRPESCEQAVPDTPDDAGTNCQVRSGAQSSAGGARLAVKRGKRWIVRADDVSRMGAAVAEAPDPASAFAALQAIEAAAFDLAETDDDYRRAVLQFARDPAIPADLSDVAILEGGFFLSLGRAVGSFGEPYAIVDPASVGQDLARKHPVLLVPSGALSVTEGSGQLRAGIAAFVAAGGTLAVFAQQRSWDYAVLPTPSGEPIRGWGWYEDGSCYYQGAYIETFHPVLASQKTPLVTASLDGFFDSIPDESTVLLRRTKNGLPAMFMYAYGQGHVIVSSSYDDWGGYNQAGSAARALIRDTVAWAKKPAELPLHTPGSSVSLDLGVSNLGSKAATQVRLQLMSPSRDRVVSDQTVSVDVPAGGQAEVSFSYAFPPDAELGIYHVDYDLLDASGESLQPVSEDDSGRIVVAQPPDTSAYIPPELRLTILMPDGEDVLVDSPKRFVYRISNASSADKHVRTYWVFNHETNYEFGHEFVIPAHGSVERELVVSNINNHSETSTLWIHVFQETGTPPTSPPPRPPGETWPFALRGGKGYQVHHANVRMTVESPDPVLRAPGAVVDVPVRIQYLEPSLAWSGRIEAVGRDGVVGQRDVSLQPMDVWEGVLPVTLPSTPPRWSESFLIALRREGAGPVAARNWTVRMAAPDLRSAGLAVPTWSRTAANPVTWLVENPSAAAVSSGTVRARLFSPEGGAIVWEAEQPLVAGPHQTVPVSFEVPSLGLAHTTGTLELTADSHFLGSRPAKESRRVSAGLRGTLGALTSVDAGQSGILTLALRNEGDIREEGQIQGAIQDVAALGPQSFSLAPGAATTLTFPFGVPPDTHGGPHAGSLEGPGFGRMSFAQPVRRTMLAVSVAPGPFAAGETVHATVQNVGGASAAPTITLRIWPEADPIRELTSATTLAIPPGGSTQASLALPTHLPSGAYRLAAEAVDAAEGVRARDVRQVAVVGTSATLTVAMDQEVYSTGSVTLATVNLANGPDAPLDGLLLVEATAPCDAGSTPERPEHARAPVAVGATGFHVAVWDGAEWVERSTRTFSPSLGWDVVDLEGAFPPGAGELRVRLTLIGTEDGGELDYAALMSQGALHAPSEALSDGGFDVLSQVSGPADYSSVHMGSYTTVTLRFVPVPGSALVIRASEGRPACSSDVLWQRTWPVSLGPTQADERTVSSVAPWGSGDYVARALVLTRDGVQLASAQDRFLVVPEGGGLVVSLDPLPGLVRTSGSVSVSGVVRNLGTTGEPDLVLRVSAQRGEYSIHDLLVEPLSLDAGTDHPFSSVFAPASYGFTAGEVNLIARVVPADNPSYARTHSSATLRLGAPDLRARFEVPSPPLRTAVATPALVQAEVDDMDAVMGPAFDDLTGPLPFPVVLEGQTFDRFRQSRLGLVELVPLGLPDAWGAGGLCVSDLSNAQTAAVAGLLSVYDPAVGGFVGHKVYLPGEADGAGREFPSPTLVFFWQAPVEGGAPGEINRVQILLSQDGLLRIEAAAPFVVPAPCGQGSGVTLPGGAVIAPSGLGTAFAVRVERGVGREAFSGELHLTNAGTYPATATVDFGPLGGPRHAESVTVPVGVDHTFAFSGQVAVDTVYTADVTGDLETSLSKAAVVSEGVLARYVGQEALEPGPVGLPVRVAKLGGVAGPVTVVFTLTGGTGSQTVERTYDLEPGFWFDDVLGFSLEEGPTGLQAVANGMPLTWEGPGSLVVAPRTRVSMSVTPGSPGGGVWPVAISVANSGLDDFEGEVQMVGPAGPRAGVGVVAGETGNVSLEVDLGAVEAGPAPYTVRLVGSSGNALQEQVISLEVLPAELSVVATPDGQSLPIGGWRDLAFRVSNSGHQRGSGKLWMKVLDEEREQQIEVVPGAPLDVTFRVYVDDDVEAKTYVIRYGLDLPGQPTVEREARVQVEGIRLAVNATLDQPAYLPGDVAHFNVSVQNEATGLGTEYLVRVHYADFDVTRPITADPGATETFDIPLPVITGEPVFLGITHPLGRSLYINTYHLRGADAVVRVTLDAGVYAPGATVSVQISPASAGTLTLTGPGYTETFEVSGPTARTFGLPGDLPAGTQFVTWSFIPVGGGAGASGQVPFDVSGLRIRVFEARLDQGRYETGEAMSARLLINTNQPASVTLRAFLVDPEGSSVPLGEVPLALDPQEDLLDIRSWPMNSAVAGLHRLAYGFYRGDTLLAAGSIAFDVGPAAVLSVRTNKFAYPDPGETVQVLATVFVSGPADLEIDVDGETAETRELTQSGIVEVEIPLTGVAPGRHALVGRAVGGGYSSTRQAVLELGTSLPDLVVGPPRGRAVTLAGDWKLVVTVANAGRTEAGATSVTFSNAGAPLASAPVPSLGPGASVEVEVDWNVMGAAGSHEIQATVDPSGAVTEFSEHNNLSVATVEVPSLAMGVTTASSYPANVEATFTLSVTNLTAGSSYSGLTGTVSITRPDASVLALPAVGLPDVGPLGSVTAAAPWAVGQSEPGVYGVSAELADSGGAVSARGLTSFQVTPTIALGGTVSATPNPVGVGEPLALQGHLENAGNVAADGTATFELVAADQTIAASFGTQASVPLGGGADVLVDVPALDVTPAEYSLRLGLDVAGVAYPAAAASLTVSGPAVLSGLSEDFSPRVLVYVGGRGVERVGWPRRMAFVAESLQGMRVTRTGDPEEFARLMRSGAWNTYVVMNSSGWALPEFIPDLREAVHRGDGLVWAQWAGGSTSQPTAALGAAIGEALAPGAHAVALVDSPLGAAQSFEVRGYVSHVALTGASQVGTMDGTWPAVALFPFGLGQSVTFAFDPSVAPADPARPNLLQLFANAVAYAAPDGARQARAGVVVPLSFSATNPGSLPVSVELVAHLPAGLTVGAVDDDPVQTDPPTWAFSIAPQETKRVRFSVALPDGSGTYLVGSTLRLNGVASQSPPEFALDVAGGMDERLGDVRAFLEDTTVSPKDQAKLDSALESIRNAAATRPNPPASFGLQLKLAGQATEQLRLISSADVSWPWAELDHLMAGWARAWFVATPGLVSSKPLPERYVPQESKGGTEGLREGKGARARR